MKLRSGAVLSSSLYAKDTNSLVAGFNKTYKNNALRAGIIVKSYSVDDSNNYTKLTTEYDVVVIEQDENRAITPITYKNCIKADALGSIADYVDVTLRSQKKVKNKLSQGKDFQGQDGAIVLLLCLDGSSEKAIIIGGLNHPDRNTKLKGNKQILAAEFNGISISVEDDGSANLTFKGATDNEGKPKDSSQGNTTIDIEKDGTLQFKNKGVTKRLEKGGNYLLNTEGSLAINSKKEQTIKTEDKFNLEAKSDASLKMNKLLLEAQGSASLKAQSFDVTGESKIDLKSQMVNIEADSLIQARAAQIVMDGQTFLGGPGGQPVLLPTTQVLTIGNLGIPAIGIPIGPFATKTFAL